MTMNSLMALIGNCNVNLNFAGKHDFMHMRAEPHFAFSEG